MPLVWAADEAWRLLKSDPAAVLAQSEDIKARYARLFKM